jgi:DNA-binding PucR family transcriptional regulator
LLSRAAALNWDTEATATVLVGMPPPERNVSVPLAVHNTARQHDRAALSVVQGSLLVAIVSGPVAVSEPFVTDLLNLFAEGPVVIGPTTPNLGAAHTSAIDALAGIEAVAGWPSAPRPVHSLELLPERALLGDQTAMTTLNDSLITPLTKGGDTLTITLDAYLDSGGSVESCARELFVHPNTVRYRLKRISDITGRDPMNPRDAYVLRVATTVGRLARVRHDMRTVFSSVTAATGHQGSR